MTMLPLVSRAMHWCEFLILVTALQWQNQISLTWEILVIHRRVGVLLAMGRTVSHHTWTSTAFLWKTVFLARMNMTSAAIMQALTDHATSVANMGHRTLSQVVAVE